MRNIANINTCNLTHETHYNYFEYNNPFLNANTVYELAQPNTAVTFSNTDARELGKLSNPEDTLTHREFWLINFPIYQDATRVDNCIKYSTTCSRNMYQSFKQLILRKPYKICKKYSFKNQGSTFNTFWPSTI